MKDFVIWRRWNC